MLAKGAIEGVAAGQLKGVGRILAEAKQNCLEWAGRGPVCYYISVSAGQVIAETPAAVCNIPDLRPTARAADSPVCTLFLAPYRECP